MPCEQPGRVTRHRAARIGVESREEDREKEELTKTPERLEGSKSSRRPQKQAMSNEKTTLDKSKKKTNSPKQAKAVSKGKKKGAKSPEEPALPKNSSEVMMGNSVKEANETSGQIEAKEANEEKVKIVAA